MSKLIVEVCRVDKIENLTNADKMQMATIKGWQCLISKDRHYEGELVIFVPPDAMIPDNLVEALKLGYLKGTNRVRTVKLRGYISQGLVLKFTDFVDADLINACQPRPTMVEIHHKLSGGIGFPFELREGDDVAEALGITKYEPAPVHVGVKKDTFFVLWNKFITKEITLRRFLAKTFALVRDYFKPKKKVNPNFDMYTDLDNIKHYPDVFEDGEEVVITEKIHGTNFRAGTLTLNETVIGRIKQYFTKATHEFCYGSHRVQKSAFSGKGFYGEDVYGQIAKRYNLKDVIPADYIIYGEIYGQKIQELTYGLEGIDVVFFDLKYKGEYLSWKEFYNFCAERNLPVVPTLWGGRFTKDVLKMCTEGKTTLPNTDHIREGCVVKPIIEGYNNRCGRKILKSISAEYLLTKKQENPEEIVDDNAEYPH